MRSAGTGWWLAALIAAGFIVPHAAHAQGTPAPEAASAIGTTYALAPGVVRDRKSVV